MQGEAEPILISCASSNKVCLLCKKEYNDLGVCSGDMLPRENF